MAYKNYNVEGKYHCNHPESDFQDNGKGPIEMKKEDFIEYTHRNETANLQYDVWAQKQRDNMNQYENTSRNERTNSYQTLNRLAYEKKDSYQTSKKSSRYKEVLLLILLIFRYINSFFCFFVDFRGHFLVLLQIIILCSIILSRNQERREQKWLIRLKKLRRNGKINGKKKIHLKPKMILQNLNFMD